MDFTDNSTLRPTTGFLFFTHNRPLYLTLSCVTRTLLISTDNRVICPVIPTVMLSLNYHYGYSNAVLCFYVGLRKSRDAAML
ncbi:hypothetical protein LX36DRAFT_315629 [Colletotrichum falcatum]|nr:hypothetical protein LX36DRAFT_315629 [Colletotrichum falcatum]